MTNEFTAFAQDAIDATLAQLADAEFGTPEFATAGYATEMPAGFAVEAPVDPARALLDDMMARVGVDGLAAALGDPGLLAQIDQHAAAVRESLRGAGRIADAEGLAAYARSIVAAADRMGRPVPEAGRAYVSRAAWLGAEWHLMRLVAVCMIAESAGLL